MWFLMNNGYKYLKWYLNLLLSSLYELKRYSFYITCIREVEYVWINSMYKVIQADSYMNE